MRCARAPKLNVYARFFQNMFVVFVVTRKRLYIKFKVAADEGDYCDCHIVCVCCIRK